MRKKPPKVNLTKLAKLDGKWQRFPVVWNANGSVKAEYVLVNDRPFHAPDGAYCLDWYENGKRLRLSVGTDASDAKQAKDDKEKELQGYIRPEAQSNGNGNQSAKTPLHEAIANFLEKADRDKRKKTFQAYRTALTAFQAVCSKVYVQDVDAMDLARFKTALENGGIKYAYLKSYKSEEIEEHGKIKIDQEMPAQGERSVYNKREIVTYLLKAHNVRRADGSPILQKNDREKPESDKHKAYSREDIEALFAACDDTEKTWFKFFLLTGMREQEVIFQTWDNIDFRNRLILVRDNLAFNYKLKTRKSRREIPMGESLSALLKTWKDNTCRDCALVFPTSGCRPKWDFLDCLKRVAKRAKVRDVTLHRFRATYATWAHRSGMDAKTIQDRLGHTDLETTQGYLSSAEGKEAIAKTNAFETYVGV